MKRSNELPSLAGCTALGLLALLFVGLLTPSAIAQERESGRKRSAEGEAGRRRSQERPGRRSPEGEAGRRRSPEAEAGRRRSAERDAGPRRSAEGNGRRENPLGAFRPQTPREAALYRMILNLQRELASVRAQVQRRGRGPERRDTAERREGRQTDERWRFTKAGKVFLAYDKNKDDVVTLEEWLKMTNGNTSDVRRRLQTRRFQEAEPSGDGRFTPIEFIDWYTRGRYAKPRRRDGEGDAKRGPRDGESGTRRERDQ